MRRQRIRPILRFLREEAGSGVVLLAATIAALAWANSPLAASYESLWSIEIAIGPPELHLTEDVRHWINDALMALFFFVVGLELSREVASGELRDPRKSALPVVAAIGGMAAPALIYLALNSSGPGVDGWAIPMATDIAFAVGVLALFGRRISDGLRIFLLSLAIVDDIGAIVVIAAVYSDAFEATWLAIALAAAGVYGLVAQRLVRGRILLVVIAVGVWYATLRSGVHPTIAGVALGLLTPMPQGARARSFPDVESRLHPVSSMVVIPIFALANAGVEVDGNAVGRALGSRVFWGIVAGLVVGKLLGIWGPSVLLAGRRIARLPDGVGRSHLLGAAALGGIGFTVALFIAGLAFEDAERSDIAKLGVLVGSATSAAIGAAVLLWTTRRAPPVSTVRR